MTPVPLRSELPSARVLSLGEALIDVVIRADSTQEHVGGSPLNVAVGMATLGQPTCLCAYWGKDSRGEAVRGRAEAAGVEICPGTDTADRTPVAYAHIDDKGRATYDFELTWAVPHLPDLSRFGHLHTGSIAATLEPGGSSVVDAVTRMRDYGTVSYDPNIRPALMHSPELVAERIEHLVAMSDVVKASDEDLSWLYPGVSATDTMRRWAQAGPALVVVTRGQLGADALLASNHELLHLDNMQVEVADTVGAGDSFMAGLLTGLLDAGLLGSAQARQRFSQAEWPDVQPALHRALATSALTVSHSGSYAPAMAEVVAVLATDPLLR
ncbi:carbohydrate kinase [Mycobacterium sp. OTB74]|uniref:carbohydrate kinase family protein n=1 Tax=Mycobacterium sp. OTB74 TaxID=1853452 RepID=UPI002474BCAD|nr:carbohydrate kinase [Mycobacterium sp. OTB74]MDH6243316.1 fructokinase [Mycobacterium sp. OTB74]